MKDAVEGSMSADAAMPKALSMTHQHLLAVVCTELATRCRHHDLFLVDAGCGDGRLLEYLAASLPLQRQGMRFDLKGFDVIDHGVQPAGYFDQAVRRLEHATPSAWRDRLSLIGERDPWPYPDGSLDVVVSNQVLEHVADHRHFFDEVRRVLRPGGFAVHLFPLRHVVVEPHLMVPFAHWAGGTDMIAAVIRLSNNLGIGRFASGPERDLKRYVEAHVDFLVRFTNYRSASEILVDAKRSRLHASFRYTPHYYAAKLRAVAGLPPRFRYGDAGALHSFAAVVLRYVSSSTLLLTRDEPYSRPPLPAGEEGTS